MSCKMNNDTKVENPFFRNLKRGLHYKPDGLESNVQVVEFIPPVVSLRNVPWHCHIQQRPPPPSSSSHIQYFTLVASLKLHYNTVMRYIFRCLFLLLLARQLWYQGDLIYCPNLFWPGPKFKPTIAAYSQNSGRDGKILLAVFIW